MLLIVPYGIETTSVPLIVRYPVRLLIVPYGIETGFLFACSFNFHLLIVPYGIETRETGEEGQRGRLLIVPYGIETPWQKNSIYATNPFNRTLWN